MNLFVEPDYNSHTISCVQQLQFSCLNDLTEKRLYLDCVTLNIKKIKIVSSPGSSEGFELGFITTAEKLIVKLPTVYKKGDDFEVIIEYSAQPKRGFRFIDFDDGHLRKIKQTWTQGQMVESRFWFPCIDEPQIKFTWEISVAVPNEFSVISNGQRMDITHYDNDKKLYKWKQDRRCSGYLVSIITGKFYEGTETYGYHSSSEQGNIQSDTIELSYFVPEERKESVKRTFGTTPEMMAFFEKYFNTKFPYIKYSQTTVQDFEYGGMENVTCTTLREDDLLDDRAAIDDTSTRNVISHELAHQWFGNLITCRDWAHIWLNEGMATYSEALYIEHSEKLDEFHYYLQAVADYYFSKACIDYKRPIVTNDYKYPDELFDAHAYQKGSWVFHMLRNLLGEENFRLALRKCLLKFSDKNFDTEEFRRLLEEISKRNLDPFFKQWLYTAGHPQLKIFYDVQSNTLKITQIQKELFVFDLEIKIYTTSQTKTYTHTLSIKDFDNVVNLSEIDGQIQKHEIEFISVDPNLRILKELKEYVLPPKMILKQVQNGETIIERIQGLRGLNRVAIVGEGLEDEAIQILEHIITQDTSSRVSSVAAFVLSNFNNNKSLESLWRSLGVIESYKPRERAIIKRSLIRALGRYASQKPEIRDMLEGIIVANRSNESYNVQAISISMMGNYKDRRSFEVLKQCADMKGTLRDIIPVTAINTLGTFYTESEFTAEVIELLKSKTLNNNSNSVREAAVTTLSRFILDNNSEIHIPIFELVMDSLEDRWPDTRIACLTILESVFSPDDSKFDQNHIDRVIMKLTRLIDEDVNYGVRRIAEIALVKIREREAKRLKERLIAKETISEHILRVIHSRIQNNLMPDLDFLH
jgi:aminopeptidase N